MGSVILQTATRYMLLLLLLFSVFLLITGHNEPGGGFTGGLVAAAAIALYATAYNVTAARELLRINPPYIIGGGLLAASGSGLYSMITGKPFMTSARLDLEIPGFRSFKIATPSVFDTGVYIVVVGVTLLIILSLAEESDAS